MKAEVRTMRKVAEIKRERNEMYLDWAKKKKSPDKLKFPLQGTKE